MPKEHEYRWLALEATKAYSVHKTSCLTNNIEPMEAHLFMREFTDYYILATMEVKGFIKDYVEEWGETEKDIKL